MKVEQGTLTVKFTDANGKEAEQSSPTSYNRPETSDDLIKLMNENLDETLASYSYGRNLRQRATDKAAILKTVEGPGKSIDKQVKAFVDTMTAMGLKISEADARTQVLALIEGAKAKQAA